MITVTAIQNTDQKIDRLCYLFLIFLIGSMAGWVYEEIFYWITEGMLRNRGFCTARGCPSTASERWAFMP